MIAAAVVLSLIGLVSCSEKKPDDETLILYARAQSVYAEGRFAESAAMLDSERALRKFVPALVLRGKALYFAGELDEARSVFTRALKLRPSQTESSVFLARIYREQHDEQKALAIVENLLADDSSNIRALRLAAQLSSGKTGPGETGASAYLNRAVEAAGETSLVLLDRARLRWREGRGAEALRDLRGAKGLIPAQNPIYRTIENLEAVIAAAGPENAAGAAGNAAAENQAKQQGAGND
jgi:tetratricopeptide (TPR) repeat protein